MDLHSIFAIVPMIAIDPSQSRETRLPYRNLFILKPYFTSTHSLILEKPGTFAQASKLALHEAHNAQLAATMKIIPNLRDWLKMFNNNLINVY